MNTVRQFRVKISRYSKNYWSVYLMGFPSKDDRAYYYSFKDAVKGAAEYIENMREEAYPSGIVRVGGIDFAIPVLHPIVEVTKPVEVKNTAVAAPPPAPKPKAKKRKKRKVINTYQNLSREQMYSIPSTWWLQARKISEALGSCRLPKETVN